jgi:hypothetical protein
MRRQHKGFEATGNLRRIGVRQHRHCGLAPSLSAVLLRRTHIRPCLNQVVYDIRQLDNEAP